MHNFIKDIKEQKDIDKEKKLVDKELNKIRTKFVKGSLSGANTKKYIWKLAYAHNTGYTIDFGYN